MWISATFIFGFAFQVCRQGKQLIVTRGSPRLPCVVDEVGRITLAVADFGGYNRQFETRDTVRLKEVFSQRCVVEVVS